MIPADATALFVINYIAKGTHFFTMNDIVIVIESSSYISLPGAIQLTHELSAIFRKRQF
jgi:hypothetical protein